MSQNSVKSPLTVSLDLALSGKGAPPKAAHDASLGAAAQALAWLRQQAADTSLELLGVPARTDDVKKAQARAKEIIATARTVAVLGIGGSSLGGQALTALRKNAVPFVEFHDNPDPFSWTAALKRFDLKKTHFIAISKSGGTAEVMVQALTAVEALKKAGVKNIGKHFTIAAMLEKDSVQRRLASGLSFTEFSYMTLQAADFLQLQRTQGVEMQMGGADQWGNITAGISLIRRATGEVAHGVSQPLLLTADGRKMGKTESGSIMLDPSITSPYAFYQYWLNADDADVPTLLNRLTLKPREEIDAIVTEHAADPGRRIGQRAFALDLTSRVHGVEEAERQVRVSAAAFASEPVTDPEVLDVLFREVGGHAWDGEGSDPLSLAVDAGLYPSRSEARRAIAQGGLSVNGVRIAAPDQALPDPVAGRYHLFRAGRKRLTVVRRDV